MEKMETNKLKDREKNKEKEKPNIEMLEEWLTKNQTDTAVMLQLAELYKDTGDHKKAQEYRERAYCQDEIDFPEFADNRRDYKIKMADFRRRPVSNELLKLMNKLVKIR